MKTKKIFRFAVVAAALASSILVAGVSLALAQEKDDTPQVTNYWEKLKLWDVSHKGNEADRKLADQLLPLLLKDAYIVKLKPANNFNPRTTKEFLDGFRKYFKRDLLKGERSGTGVFRTTKMDDILVGSFLTIEPEKLKADIKANPLLEFISSEKVSSETFIQHMESKLESFENDEGVGFWKNFNLWFKSYKGSPEEKEKADKLLPELIKGVHLMKFKPVNGANPKNPGEFLSLFNKHSSLRSGNDCLGGASFFRTTKTGDILVGSFLTETPGRMKTDIESNPSLQLISDEELTKETFIKYVESPQESL